MISSFDIFDTCLIRKCGTPENFFDVFSLRAFNQDPPEWARQEFVAARRLTEQKLWSENPHYTLEDIWAEMDWTHPLLKSKKELCELEQELEREMLVPVLSMRDKVNECRKSGNKIIFISDMYLSSKFLIDVMRTLGFYQDGDALYVSCESNAAKYDGGLFQYVKEKEGLTSFRHWHHYGDNKLGDYKVPKKLGIKCTLINHEYTPYQKQWKDNDYSLGFKYPGILAGLGRALHYSEEWNTHTDFVLDIIAPFYCSLVYRMMNDAKEHGIKRLYFCARDAYMMYKIALEYKVLFPEIECKFLYISRKALYEGDDEAKIKYYEQEGLATKIDYVGIVDIRSSGKTLQYLNNYLEDNGYRKIRGYYYELFIARIPSYAVEDYYCEMSGNYNPYSSGRMVDTWQIWENFMPMNMIPKTVNYVLADGIAQPVFGTDATDGTPKIQQTEIIQHDQWCIIHEKLILLFCQSFIHTGMSHYVDAIFQMSIDRIFSFINNPLPEYLVALEDLYGVREHGSTFVPFVKKETWLRLLFTHAKDSIWKYGTLKYSNFYETFMLIKKLKP